MESFATESTANLSFHKITSEKVKKFKYVKYKFQGATDSVSFKMSEKLNNDIMNIFH